MFNLSYVPVEELINDNISYTRTKILYTIGICSIISIFTVLGTISSIVTLINKNIRNYSIHILSGAKIKDIINRISFSILLITAISIIPSLIVFKLSISTILTILTVLIIDFIILIFPIKRLNKSNISTMFSRKE